MEATFCFVDLAGFSALTEAHGDDAAADLALRFTGLVTETLAGDGRLVKTIGDAVLAGREPFSSTGYPVHLAPLAPSRRRARLPRAPRRAPPR